MQIINWVKKNYKNFIFFVVINLLILPFFNKYFNNYKELEFINTYQIPLVLIDKTIPNLNIQYNNKDIFQLNKTLVLIKLSIENIGFNDIIQTDYDTNMDFGIDIQNAEVIYYYKTINSNSNNIKESLKLEITENNHFLKFNKLTIPESTEFEITFIVLKDLNKTINLNPRVYIAGINEKIHIKNNKSFQEINSLSDLVFKYKDRYFLIGMTIILTLILEFILLYLIFILFPRLRERYKKAKKREIRYDFFGKSIDYDLKKLGVRFGFVIRFSDIVELTINLERIDAIRCFLANFEEKEQFAKLKYLYQKNIEQYISIANKILEFENKLNIINNKIDNIEKKIYITKKLTLKSIPTYTSYYNKIQKIRLYSDKKEELDISDYKYKVYNEFISKEMRELLSEKDLLSNQLNSFYSKLIDLQLISSYKDLQSLINKNIILSKDKDSKVTEDKVFINKLDELIEKYKIEIDYIKIENELKKSKEQLNKYTSDKFFDDFY